MTYIWNRHIDRRLTEVVEEGGRWTRIAVCSSDAVTNNMPSTQRIKFAAKMGPNAEEDEAVRKKS